MILKKHLKMLNQKKIAGTINDKYIWYKRDDYEKPSIEQYFRKVRLNLDNTMDNLKASSEWKII